MFVNGNAKRLSKLVVCAVAGVVLVVFIACATSHVEQRRADKLINLLSDVTPGVTSKIEVQAKLQSESFRTGNSDACQSDGQRACDQFEFTNKLLSLLHAAPGKTVWVTLDYRNGIVISKSVQFAEEPRLTAVTRQLTSRDEGSLVEHSAPERQVTVNIVNPQNAMVKVYDDQNVSADQRLNDWRLDLSCFSKLGACSDPRSILPGAFPKV